MTPVRLITEQDAARFVGTTRETFRSEVEAGRWPRHVLVRGKRRLYDIAALSRTVDALSGIVSASRDDGEARALEALHARRS